jgi:hypothetical protein
MELAAFFLALAVVIAVRGPGTSPDAGGPRPRRQAVVEPRRIR